MDWEEFRALQKAYFEAHVIDIEAVTDIGIFAAIDRVLKKFDCSHILDGRNHKTESVLGNWINKNPSNLLNIAQTHGVWPIRKFPLRHSLDIVRISRIAEKRKNHRVLDWIEYNKVEAKKEITAELGWRDYGGKHYESVFTRFYQGYILPEKFGAQTIGPVRINGRSRRLDSDCYFPLLPPFQTITVTFPLLLESDTFSEPHPLVLKRFYDDIFLFWAFYLG